MAKALNTQPQRSGSSVSSGGRGNNNNWIIQILFVAFILSFISFNSFYGPATLQGYNPAGLSSSYGAIGSPVAYQQQQPSSPYGLHVNEYPAVALPSVRTSEEEETNIDRKFYGGAGDKAHLGGFTAFDPNGVSPTLWKHMVSYLGIKSLLDVGCGRGISTSWFVTHGLDYVVCVEGSHDAVEQSLLPKIKEVPNNNNTYDIVEHDFSRGPWWPERTVDAVWCVEFTEHVGRNFQPNYITAWRKAALIFMTHSLWGGWHHVEVHDDHWWISRMEQMGFVYSERLTKEMRDKAKEDRNRLDLTKRIQDEGKNVNVGQHLWGTLLVFINPLVASRIEHAHLFAEHGCNSPTKGRPQECGKKGGGPQVEDLTPLPDRYKPLPLTQEMDEAWREIVWDL